ncbi:MAG: hypothetical protein K940chlam1_00476 [Candidatus Anoxychlamydiales bacterium]|nr:hypothetical protein [Candidatus Anoxychlamydiales bacterium]NGX35616.1 hypothetical protein [Candidatus Anoxychlamydiales bacterium]
MILRNKIFESFLDLFYPHLCLHCSKKIEKNYFYFCKNCLMYFDYFKPNPSLNFSAVFENIGPILTFLKEMKNKNLFSIFKIVAAFLVVEHFKLKWDIPDVIVPMMEKKFLKNHIFDLSKEVAIFFKRPIVKKTTSRDTVLVISDTLNFKKFENFKSKILYKKIFCLALCFDVFFDDFNLSE